MPELTYTQYLYMGSLCVDTSQSAPWNMMFPLTKLSLISPIHGIRTNLGCDGTIGLLPLCHNFNFWMTVLILFIYIFICIKVHMSALAMFCMPIFLFWSYGRCVLELGACVTFLWTRPTPQTFFDAGSAQKLIHLVRNCEISNIGISSLKIEVEMQVLYESKGNKLYWDFDAGRFG